MWEEEMPLQEDCVFFDMTTLPHNHFGVPHEEVKAFQAISFVSMLLLEREKINIVFHHVSNVVRVIVCTQFN